MPPATPEQQQIYQAIYEHHLHCHNGVLSYVARKFQQQRQQHQQTQEFVVDENTYVSLLNTPLGL